MYAIIAPVHVCSQASILFWSEATDSKEPASFLMGYWKVRKALLLLHLPKSNEAITLFHLFVRKKASSRREKKSAIFSHFLLLLSSLKDKKCKFSDFSFLLCHCHPRESNSFLTCVVHTTLNRILPFLILFDGPTM